MSIIVQKFGGTSVADSEKILGAARKAVRAQKEGKRVVMVVSAMGKNTDLLVDLARQITDEPPAREMDMLLSTGEQVSVALMAMAIHSLGHEAISLTGAQIGIMTDSTHTKARIRSISTDRLRRALDAGKIVIAAGFQGIDEAFNITTLGRGGSDTTAVALAAALGAEVCEIYTDVDGVYTTDPRVVPEARRLKRISYDEMLELASVGAGVMHNRSIEFAKKYSVPVHVRSSFSDSPGTIIATRPEAPDRPVTGAAMVRDEARVTVVGVPDRPGAALSIFSKIAAKNIAMDMIVQNVGAEGRADISFTVLRDELPATLKAVQEGVDEVGAESFNYEDDVSKISVVGLGMETQPGVAETMFRTLAEQGINILMITTSEIKISVLVQREYATEALRVVHGVFQLETEPAEEDDSSALAPPSPAAPAGANGLVARLQGMEDLLIEGIHLDESQARVTMLGVPDTPGLAAQVFDEVAENGIVVDMIVQSVGRQERANVSFTVPQDDLAKAMQVAEALAEGFGCPPPTCSPRVAKLSVSGTGMKSHTGVAIRVFRSLAEVGVNVDMISTSEVRLNVVVDGERGQAGLEALKREFAGVML
jgi:aspartate kinase